MGNLLGAEGNTLTLIRSKSQNKAFIDQSFLNSQMLVFVDSSLKDIKTLVDGVHPKAEVILINPQEDGIQRITEILTQRRFISSVHLIAHGSSGALQLGLSDLSLKNLDTYANQVQAWSYSLRGASLLIYGCEIASGQKGINFLKRLHQLTGANIAASTEKVGNQELGGNWQLDYRIGEVTSELAFLPSVRETYSGIFANYDESVEGDISDNPAAPLSLTLEEGTNSLSATSSEGDLEYVTVTIPNGLQLDSLFLSAYASVDPVSFVAVQSGSTFTEPSDPPSAINVGNLLGWSHFGSGQTGTDILDNIGNGSGAIGFTGSLPSGDYTFWLQQLGEPTTYTLDFNVSSEDDMTTPTVSLQTISGTYDTSDNILASELVRSVSGGASLLTLAFNVDGEIPEGGLVVDVNSDTDLVDYFSGLGTGGFTPGGQILEAIYDSETGEGTGFKFRIDQPNAIINLRLLNNPEAEGAIPATFTLAAGEGYTVDPDANTSNVTFYDTLANVPAPTVTPEVSFSVSNTALVESEGNLTTLTFELSEAPPPEGVLVYVASPQRFLGEFDIFNADVEGGAFPAPNFSSTGFFFKILEQEASITLPAFPDNINAEGEEVTEGIEAFTLGLQQGPGYTIASGTEPVTITIADTPESQLQVNFTTSPATLIESATTPSVHTFSLSAPPPDGGVTISVSATNLGEFDLDSIVVTGGTISGVTATGFNLTLTSQTATITLPVLNDGVEEGLETATFTVEAGEAYQVNLDASSGTFNIVDTPGQVPVVISVTEPNDIISLATDTGLSASNSFVSITTTIDHETANRYPVDGGFLYVDATEDVDLYKVELKAGDTIKIDTDSNQFADGRKVDTWLRVFDSTGAELASNDDGAAPNEIFDSRFQSYIEFTAPSDGLYYVGVSLYNNGEYDPLTPASGTGEGDLIDLNEYGPGEYTLNISLNDLNAFISEPTVIPPGTGEGPAISLFTVTGTYGSDFDNLGFEIVSPGLVETAPEGAGSGLNLVIVANGPIPEGGIELFINSDIVLTDYFGGVEEGDYGVPYGGNLNNKPFTRGGQFLNPVYDENGKATGFIFRLEDPFATISLNPSNRPEAETDGIETATFSLVESAGYTLSPISSSTVTFYDTVDAVPAPTIIPEVSLEISPTELIESEETVFTFTLSLSEPPPPGGVQVYVSGNAVDFLNELAVFEAQFTGGVPIADGRVSGFYFQMFAQTATITLPVFNSVEVTEGIEQFDVRLVPGAGYTINPEQDGALLTIKDTPTSQIQVSLSSEQEVLIESEGTVATLNLSLSGAPPEDGVTVTINAPELSEFDADSLQVTGGELISSSETGLTVKITEQNATLSLAVANNGVAEALEEATFTVTEGGTGYQVSLDANSATFTIADTPELAPTSTEESNDTIATAIATGLTAASPSVNFEGEINQYFAQDAEGNSITVDASEDVDFYSFVLQAGDKVAIDVDSIEYVIEELGPQRVDTELRLFNAAGEQLASNFNGFAPDELFVGGRDSYLEFTATEGGTYYVGVAQWNNRTYDPFTLGSGSGRISPATGVNVGPYTVDISLTPVPTIPVVSFSATPTLISEAEGSVLTLAFDTTGVIPTEGITVNLQGDVANILTEFTAAQLRFDAEGNPFYRFGNVPVTGGTLDRFALDNSDVSSFSFTILDPTATIALRVFDDLLEESDQTYTYTLESGEGYLVDSTANSATFTVTDGVPGGVGPTVGVSATSTTLYETGDSAVTITFTLDSAPSPEGLVVYLDSGVSRSIGEFDVANVTTTGGEIVSSDEDASAALFRITSQTATITVSAFNDGVTEGLETYNFTLLDGELYEVNPNASAVTITIDDKPRFVPVIGTLSGEIFEAGLTPGFEGSNDVVFGGGDDDLFDTTSGNGGNRLYGGSGDDIFILGSDDRAVGGAGNDQFYLLGGNNIITGGLGADQFWVAVGENPESSNTITDFDLANDVIGIGGLGISFDDLTLTQQNSDTLIGYGDQELARLLKINANSLTGDSFVFA